MDPLKLRKGEELPFFVTRPLCPPHDRHLLHGLSVLFARKTDRKEAGGKLSGYLRTQDPGGPWVWQFSQITKLPFLLLVYMSLVA